MKFYKFLDFCSGIGGGRIGLENYLGIWQDRDKR